MVLHNSALGFSSLRTHTHILYLSHPQAAIEAQLRQRLELQGAHRMYMELKAKKLQAEREEEEQFRQQMMAKFAEDDKIEQMNAQKRRMKQLGETITI